MLKLPSVVFVYEYGFVNERKTAAVALDVHGLSELMSTGSNNATVLVNQKAEILIDPDFQGDSQKFSSILPIIDEVYKNPAEENTQTVVDGVFVAISQILNDLFVVTTISENQYTQS